MQDKADTPVVCFVYNLGEDKSLGGQFVVKRNIVKHHLTQSPPGAGVSLLLQHE